MTIRPEVTLFQHLFRLSSWRRLLRLARPVAEALAGGKREWDAVLDLPVALDRRAG